MMLGCKCLSLYASRATYRPTNLYILNIILILTGFVVLKLQVFSRPLCHNHKNSMPQISTVYVHRLKKCASRVGRQSSLVAHFFRITSNIRKANLSKLGNFLSK